MRTGYKQTFFLLTVLFLSTFVLTVNQARADKVTVIEAQKDKVKCVKRKDCYQTTSGSYSAVVKLSATTLVPALEALLQKTADDIRLSPLQFTMGTFSFSGTLSSVNKGKAKVTKSGINGTWVQTHSECTKYDTSGQVCKKSKIITDGTVKISLNTKKGGTLLLSGQSADEHGQKIYSGLCQDNNLSQFTDNATITIGQTVASASLNVGCKITKSTKNSFGLVNIAINAQLPPATFFVRHLIQTYDNFFLAPTPIGYPDQSGFNEFTNGLDDGFVSFTKKESYRKAEAKTFQSAISFIYYITSSKVHLANPAQFKQFFESSFNLGWTTYPADTVFFPVYSTKWYDSPNGDGSLLYYSLSEEEFDAVKSDTSVSSIINHSLTNVLNHQTSNDFSLDFGQDDKTEDVQIFGVADSHGQALIKISKDTSIYSLRMEVKQSY